MLNHRQGFAGKPLYSSSPKYQIQSSHDSTGDIEFDFWGVHDSDTMYNENFSDQFGTEIEFQVQASLVQEGLGGVVNSLPLWKRNSSKKVQYESSPLLPHDHHPSNLSPTSRRKVIADGRKQLMEMVKDMPESSYELSLKDLVNEQHGLEEVQEGPVESQEDQPKKQKKNTKKGIKKVRQLSRIESLESETFLLKMFFPTSLSFKKKTKEGKSSKLSPSPSFEDTKDRIDKEWWLKRFFVTGENKRSRENSRNGSTSSSNSSTSRYLFNLLIRSNVQVMV